MWRLKNLRYLLGLNKKLKILLGSFRIRNDSECCGMVNDFTTLEISDIISAVPKSC
jgi:hypothetical protein